MTKKKYYVIVIGTDEEIEVRQETYENLAEDIITGKAGSQVTFRDVKDNVYLEQRINIRMRTKNETTL